MKNLWNVHKLYSIHCLHIWWLVLVNTITGLQLPRNYGISCIAEELVAYQNISLLLSLL
jgi:hypothetical protein